ncbi:FadR/GntR family transcriptional regulator [Nocardioides sp.]|uniref:FadR/GntR family transcriptional regulator n=1 Tax=Nocardioides sp. TaxID=35761 RepID=UPI0025F80F60|nr:FadR/GntR family transcriptional regulator [Nocardioides sp.]
MGTADIGTFEALSHRTLVSETANFIKSLILEGKLKPGDRLPSERELSEALQVSRATLREAIRSLMATNILTSSRAAGTRVGSLETEELLEPVRFSMALAGGSIDELFELRSILEPEVAALAASNGTDEQHAAVLDLAERTAGVVADPAALVAVDEQLHHMVATCSGNGIIVNVLKTIELLGHASRSVTVHAPRVAEVTIEHHLDIARAIADRDGDRARSAMKHHLETIRELTRDQR